MRKRICSRRAFVRVLAAGAAGVVCRRAAGQPAKAPALDAAALHTLGVRLLLSGKQFEKAAAYLMSACEKEPENPAHPLALGCAWVSRAASIAYAAFYTHSLSQARANFGKKLSDWENSREEQRAEEGTDFDDAAYERSRPVPPAERVFPTKDDNRPYLLSRAETEARLTELSAEAQAAWERGRALSRTPEEKAAALYVQGWGIRVLREYLIAPTSGVTLQDVDLDVKGEGTPAFALPKVPPESAVLAAFQQATEAAPDNALYWQAKGDALPEGKDSEAAYERALALRPRNAATIAYLLYRRAIGTASSKSADQWATALSLLHLAQARDKGNAWPFYEEAGILFRLAPYGMTGPSGSLTATEAEKEVFRAAVRNDAARQNGKRAIDRILDGNQAPNCAAPRYRESVPPMLAASWRYLHPVDVDYSDFARSRELARSAGGYAQYIGEFEKNGSEAERAGRAAIGMGFRLIGDWSINDDDRQGKTVIEVLVGIAVVMISSKLLKKTFDSIGETEKAAALQSELDAFLVRAAAYRKAVAPIMQHNELDSY